MSKGAYALHSSLKSMQTRLISEIQPAVLLHTVGNKCYISFSTLFHLNCCFN